MSSLEQSAQRAAARAKDPFGPPKRENYDPGSFGDLQFEHAQDRYIMERGKAYAAAHANDGKL